MVKRLIWNLVAMFISVFLAACAPTITQGPAPVPADATGISGVYQGRYRCNQGITGLTLTLKGTPEGNVEATFDFYAVPENPGVPSGSYLMTGIFFSDASLHLDPVRWIRQPPGYVMVPMRGKIAEEEGRLVYKGTIPESGCGAFYVVRVR